MSRHEGRYSPWKSILLEHLRNDLRYSNGTERGARRRLPEVRIPCSKRKRKVPGRDQFWTLEEAVWSKTYHPYTATGKLNAVRTPTTPSGLGTVLSESVRSLARIFVAMNLLGWNGRAVRKPRPSHSSCEIIQQRNRTTDYGYIRCIGRKKSSGPRTHDVHEFLNLTNPLCPDLSHFKGDQGAKSIALSKFKTSKVLVDLWTNLCCQCFSDLSQNFTPLGGGYAPEEVMSFLGFVQNLPQFIRSGLDKDESPVSTWWGHLLLGRVPTLLR